jgi:hypothetical protein
MGWREIRAIRAPAWPAQTIPGGGTEGAVEAPFDDNGERVLGLPKG